MVGRELLLERRAFETNAERRRIVVVLYVSFDLLN